MSQLKVLVMVAIGAAVAIANVSPANAFSLSIGGKAAAGSGYVSNVSGSQTITFESGAPTSGFATYSTPSGTPGVVQGSKAGHHATPLGNATKYLTIAPVGSGVAGSTGSVSVNFTKAVDFFGLYWGSVDTHNYVDLYKGNTLLKTFSGKDVSNTATGNWTGSSDNVFVDIFAGKGESFDKVVLRANGLAFETDNHAYRVASTPEPGSMLGLLAVGLLATPLLKRQVAKAVKSEA